MSINFPNFLGASAPRQDFSGLQELLKAGLARAGYMPEEERRSMEQEKLKQSLLGMQVQNYPEEQQLQSDYLRAQIGKLNRDETNPLSGLSGPSKDALSLELLKNQVGEDSPVYQQALAATEAKAVKTKPKGTAKTETLNQQAEINNPVREFLNEKVSMPSRYRGFGSSLNIIKDLKDYTTSKDPKKKSEAKEYLVQAALAKMILPENVLVQLAATGTLPTKHAIKEMENALMTGWPEFVGFGVNNFPEEIQKEATKRHGIVFNQINKMRGEGYGKQFGTARQQEEIIEQAENDPNIPDNEEIFSGNQGIIKALEKQGRFDRQEYNQEDIQEVLQENPNMTEQELRAQLDNSGWREIQ